MDLGTEHDLFLTFSLLTLHVTTSETCHFQPGPICHMEEPPSYQNVDGLKCHPSQEYLHGNKGT